MRTIWPRLLPAGGMIGICSPSGPSSAESLTRGVALLESRGYRVRVAPHTASVDPERAYLGGTDDERVSDLNALLRDPEIDLVLCARGGYGCARILDRVDYAAIQDDPKVLVGYSDITALSLAIAAKTGVISFSGPMASGGDSFGDENFDPWTGERFFQILDKSGPELRTLPHADGFAPWVVHRGPTIVKGPVVPVCFTLLTSLHGTPYVPALTGAILVMEDVHEDLYAIDRCLTQLRLSGILDRLVAVLIGSFNGVSEEETAKLAAGVPQLVLQMTPEHVAVASGVAYGHISRRLTLPLGAPGMVDLSAGMFTFVVPAA